MESVGVIDAPVLYKVWGPSDDLHTYISSAH